MSHESRRGIRVAALGASLALILMMGGISGCGGPQEGTLQGDQDPEIEGANNAMMDYAQSQGKAQNP